VLELELPYPYMCVGKNEKIPVMPILKTWNRLVNAVSR
jgi:hypothetical protein